jgi:phosphatidylglycerophosphate synthase
VAPPEFDAIVVADDPLASVRIAGLSARERARRVANRAGAARVLVVDGPRDQVIAWRDGRTCPLLVIRADQLVHPALVTPLFGAPPSDGVAVAVGPDGAYAGAYLAAGSAARHAIAAIAKGENNAAFVGAADAERIPHGEIARHAIATPEDRTGAHRLLYRILIKPQDNAISRFLFRPLSLRLTKLLVHTPITPNMLSLTVAAMVAIACVLTANADPNLVILGAVVQAASGYIDCCDGEIARLKLMSSRLGAWIDTVVDELSTVAYMAAIGWHCHLHGGHPGWDLWTAGIVVGLAMYGWSVYCIYFNIIVGVGSANSQDYAGKFEVVAADEPGAVRIRPVSARAIAPVKTLPPWLDRLVALAPNVVRRDFIIWAALVFALLHVTQFAFIALLCGGVVSAVIVTKDHVHLRRLRREVARTGQRLLSPST